MIEQSAIAGDRADAGGAASGERAGAVAGSAPLGWLLSPVIVIVGLQNLLLWRFLDFAPPWLYVLAAAALVAIGYLAARYTDAGCRVSPATLVACLAVACGLCVLGGEGRFLYANLDWQIRDAVLRDMRIYEWPFAYRIGGEAYFIRNQVGMYFIPSLVGKLAGPVGSEAALLMQNSLFIAAILAAASVLFETARTKLVALVVFVIFSGMDVLGAATLWAAGLIARLQDHLEVWAHSIQFSSHLTQVFWVPHHAIAGWLAALLYLLWLRGRVRLGVFFAAVPLLSIWSPLATMGIMPFAVYAGIVSLRRGTVRTSDVVIPLTAVALSIPTLLYQSAAGDTVGARFLYPGFRYLLSVGVEVLPYLLAAGLLMRRSRFGRATLLIVAACLLMMPFFQIAKGTDFVMRATIPALAILAVLTAEAIGNAFASGARGRVRAVGVATLAVLAVGAVTGGLEIRRSLVLRPSPTIACNLVTAWDQQVSLIPALEYFVAPTPSLPGWMQPRASRGTVEEEREVRCWSRPWRVDRSSTIGAASTRSGVERPMTRADASYATLGADPIDARPPPLHVDPR